MEVHILPEPLLQFDSDFLCDDPKLGIMAGGFFSVADGSHRSEIHYAVIGTKIGVDHALRWLENLESPIEASKKELGPNANVLIEDGEVREIASEAEDEEMAILQLFDKTDEDAQSTSTQTKRMNPDFPGFNKDSAFKCTFVNDSDNNKTILQAKIEKKLNEELPPLEMVVQTAHLYIDSYKEMLETSMPKPNICILVIPTNVFTKLASVRYGQNRFFNFKRYLKAQLITVPGAIPVQIILEDTVIGKKKGMQDLSMQAWNFSVANYYKNDSIPWSLKLKDRDTCHIGVSFHKVLDEDANLVQASVAQAFNHEGKGIIFVGSKFEWNSKVEHTGAPHLTYQYAHDLIIAVLKEYRKFNKGRSPERVVIHKTTDFWDATIHQDYAEAEGFKYGILEALGEDVEVDLVTIKSAKIKLLREHGRYPVIRGTLMQISEVHGILYTTGYIPYYETFPSVHIPHPLEISIYEGESTLKKVCEEIMALTKMNFNNCNYYDSMPITIRFAQKVGEIIQYMDEGSIPPTRYLYYM